MSPKPEPAPLPERVRVVLASAARLQAVVPDAVLVGGTAAAYYAHHRESSDHDHVLTDLAERYEKILEAAEATEGWVTNVRASSPPLTLLGSLGGIEAGLRQLRRTRSLEVCEIAIPGVGTLRVPTLEEMLRINAYLVVVRNQVRDYLDTVAMAARMGTAGTVEALIGIDAYYTDRSQLPDGVLTALLQRLAEPAPRDERVTRQLAAYEGLDEGWHEWPVVVETCHHLADEMLARLEESS